MSTTFALALILTSLGDGDPRADNFESRFQQIRPRPGESAWTEVPWLTDLHEARRRAAAEGKPMFIQAGGKANSIGAC